MPLGPHVQYAPPELPALLSMVLPSVMLYFQPPTDLLHVPDITIGRIFYDRQDAILQSDPVWLGRKMAEDSIASSERNGVPIWVGPNEPGVASGDAIARIVACERERVMRLNAVGLKACVFNFSVGWPREINGKLETAPYDEFMKWLPSMNYVGFHEYWTKEGPLDPLNMSINGPNKVWRFSYWPYDCRILVTECGIDYHGQFTDGWKSHVPPGWSLEQWAQAYARQLTDYDELLVNDGRVEGEAVYTLGPGFGWDSFDTAEHNQYFAPCYTPAPPTDTIRVMLDRSNPDSIVTLPIEEYLRGVVPAEVFPKWNMEVLKAQAVWARSVAKARVRDPRSTRHDIDNRDQIYNPEKVHPRTDQAVRETRGVYVVQNGKVMYASYVSDCGQPDCPMCEGPPGYITTNNPTGEWPGRACQWGAWYLSEHGADWRYISLFYYEDDVTLSDEINQEPGTNPGEMENEMFFDFEAKIKEFLANPGMNDAAGNGVGVYHPDGSKAKVIGIHTLTDKENTFGSSCILLAVVDKDGKRVDNAKIDWEWAGMKEKERPNPVICDKHDAEGSPGKLPIIQGMRITVRVHGTVSDSVTGLHTGAYFIAWQIGGDPVPVPPIPVPPVLVPAPGNLDEIIGAVEDVQDGIDDVYDMLMAMR